MNRLVDWRGIDFEIELLDIQDLNERLFRGELDVAKASSMQPCFWPTECGSCPADRPLGFGVGPLLLASKENVQPNDSTQVTLCPGKHTTASLLFQLFYPNTNQD